MPQSLARVLLHVIFSTKNREAWLRDSDLRKALYAYQAGILEKIHAPAVIIGGVADHVHCLCNLPRTLTIADLVEALKTGSTKWLKTQRSDFNGFHWQAGYGAFSVSQSRCPEVKEYIANQEAHHALWPYQDEFREICKKHDVDIDERYVWD
jgi:REP element-mobilizing transposase RayT